MKTEFSDAVCITPHDEIWKDISGYEGLYQISNFGRVKSLPKHRGNGRGFISQERILIATIDSKGYFKVTLCKEKIHITHRIHRLIATAFIKNPQNKPFINHINGNKKDNSISNLEWVTHQENCQHAQDNFLNKARCSEKQKKATKAMAAKRRILTINQVKKIKQLRKINGYGAYKIAKILNLKKHLVDSVIYNRSFKEVS